MSPELTLTIILTSALLMCSISAHDTNARSKRNADRRRHRSRMPSWLSQIDRTSAARMGNIRDMSAFIPAIPTESEVDCQIEYEVIRAVGGRCVRLGGIGRTAVCQSGIYLDLHNEECENILRSREVGAGQAGSDTALQQEHISDDNGEQ